MSAKSQIQTTLNDIRFGIMAAVTVGLAPYYPEPHIVGKIKWVAGGAVGMELLDWADLFFHGIPWLLLLYQVGYVVSKRDKEKY